MIHSSARASVAHNFLWLKEGGIYLVTNFAVKPNKEEYQVINDDSFMLEFDGSTTFKRVSVKADGFVRYPLNLVNFDAIEPADNKYLIDVVGYGSLMPITTSMCLKGVSVWISGTKPDLFLDQLRVDVTGTIIVMIGRVWDVSLVSGRVAHNFLRLKEGGIYSVTNFAVKPNKEEYRVIKDDSFMLEFNGSTTFKRVSVKANGFVRYPLNLVDFDAIEPANNKYLIDVAGYVSNVGRTNHLKSRSKNLDFHLANHRGQSIRVMLWGNLGEVLVEKKTKQVGACPIVLASFTFPDTVYLLSTSSTVILDDAEIPAIKALKDANSGVELKNPYTPIDLTRPLNGTIENLLMWSRNRKNNVHSFPTRPRRDGISLHVVVKGATWQKGYFFCESCNKRVDFPMLRYRLELDVFDVTAQTVVVLFDEPATALIGCLAGSLMDTKDESADDHVGLPPAISNLIGTTLVMEIKSVGSSTLDAFDGVQTYWLSSLVIEDSDVEASGDSSGYVRRNKADLVFDSNKRKRVVTKVSFEDVSGNTPQDDNTNWFVSPSDKKKRLAYVDASLE
ncbi:reverse transcriptase domain-containing protein [Tanacetum coccineum]|uniref:Reverse transcriptase domain-containing protein n=1 Tax=Tanacetum coccineum TaxID=301880 RepID=A0ABQ5GP57_9ASTR